MRPEDGMQQSAVKVGKEARQREEDASSSQDQAAPHAKQQKPWVEPAEFSSPEGMSVAG